MAIQAGFIVTPTTASRVLAGSSSFIGRRGAEVRRVRQAELWLSEDDRAALNSFVAVTDDGRTKLGPFSVLLHTAAG